MSDAVCNSGTPGTAAWRLYGYVKRAGGITCQLIRPDGTRINEPLAVFAKQARDREWDNDPEDMRAVLDLAVIKEMHHE